MSLDVYLPSNIQVLVPGFCFSTNHGIGRYDNAAWVATQVDPVWLYLAGHDWLVPGGVRSASEALGLNSENAQGAVDTFKVSQRPSMPSKSSQEAYDRYEYGSLLRNLQLFGQALSGGVVAPPSSHSENFVRHANYSGSLITKQIDYLPFDVELDFFGKTLKTGSAGGYVRSNAVVYSEDPLSVDTSAGWWLSQMSRGPLDIVPLLRFLKACEGDTFATRFWYGYYDCTLQHFSYSLKDDDLVLEWDTHMVEHTIYANFVGTYSYYLHVDLRSPDRTVGRVYRGQVLSLGRRLNEVTCVVSLVDTNGQWGGTWSQLASWGLEYPAWRSGSSYLDPVEQACKGRKVVLSLRNGRFLGKFYQDVLASWHDITPSCLFSAVDAFMAAESNVGVDILQNVAKIPDIASAMPQIKEAVQVLSRLVKRDLSTSLIKEILDLATSTELQANFQWRPIFDVLLKYLPQILSTSYALGKSTERVTARGSFRFEMHNALGREEVTLITRTKVVMDMSASALLSAVLGIDAVGLLPKASNLWDLVPFSFVANWFTGVGAAMKRAEYSLLMASIPAYFVHTYTLVSPLTEDELDLLEMTSYGPEPASLRVYIRDLSLYCPYPRDSRFGFGIPKQLPNSGVLGSLLYQLLLA